MKWNYLSVNEIDMEPDLVDLQIAIALQTCETKKDVMDLLKDVRQHERLQIIKELDEICLCPECGKPMGCYDHFCESCKQRVAVPEDGGFWVEFFKKEMNK